MQQVRAFLSLGDAIATAICAGSQLLRASLQQCAWQPTSGAGPVKAIASMKVSQSSSKGSTPSFFTSIVGPLFVLPSALTVNAHLRSGWRSRCELARKARLLPVCRFAQRRTTCSNASRGDFGERTFLYKTSFLAHVRRYRLVSSPERMRHRLMVLAHLLNHH